MAWPNCIGGLEGAAPPNGAGKSNNPRWEAWEREILAQPRRGAKRMKASFDIRDGEGDLHARLRMRSALCTRINAAKSAHLDAAEASGRTEGVPKWSPAELVGGHAVYDEPLVVARPISRVQPSGFDNGGPQLISVKRQDRPHPVPVGATTHVARATPDHHNTTPSGVSRGGGCARTPPPILRGEPSG